MEQQYWEGLVYCAELFLQCWKSCCFLCIESSLCGAPRLLTVRIAEWKSLWNIIAHSVSARGLWLDRPVPLRNRQTKWANYKTVYLLDTAFHSKNKHQFGPSTFTFRMTSRQCHLQNVTVVQHALTAFPAVQSYTTAVIFEFYSHQFSKACVDDVGIFVSVCSE